MGLVLVFDLDQTLIDSNGLSKKQGNDNIWNRIGSHLNMRLINEVFRPALELRVEKKVDAIFLLSNNSGKEYVINVIHYLALILGVDEPFDYVMIRQHSSRPQSLNPPKRIQDVKFMMDNAVVAIPYSDDLASRVYFFDDNTTHEIRKELEPDHYIEIQGPDVDENEQNMGFIAGKPDFSDYREITRVLKDLEKVSNSRRRSTLPLLPPSPPVSRGGSRKLRKMKRKSRKATKRK